MSKAIPVLKCQIGAWALHLERLNLRERTRFVLWLSERLNAKELALLLDGEVDRRSLWEVYLAERYGP